MRQQRFSCHPPTSNPCYPPKSGRSSLPITVGVGAPEAKNEEKETDLGNGMGCSASETSGRQWTSP